MRSYICIYMYIYILFITCLLLVLTNVIFLIRTITVSSCGKTFSCTGWKVGWLYGAGNTCYSYVEIVSSLNNSIYNIYVV